MFYSKHSIGGMQDYQWKIKILVCSTHKELISELFLKLVSRTTEPSHNSIRAEKSGKSLCPYDWLLAKFKIHEYISAWKHVLNKSMLDGTFTSILKWKGLLISMLEKKISSFNRNHKCSCALQVWLLYPLSLVLFLIPVFPAYSCCLDNLLLPFIFFINKQLSL